MDLPKISKTRLVDRVVETLYYKICEGELVPGQKLPGEIALSQSLGVGKPTVREAIGQLIGLGLVYRGKYGVFVSDIPTQTVKSKLTPMLLENWEIRELYEARIIIEGEVAVLACMRATNKNIDQLCQLNERMKNQAYSETDYWELDEEFHRMVALVSGNEILQTMHTLISDLFRKYEVSVNKLDYIREQTHIWHAMLIEAFKKKDIDAVRKIIRTSLTESENALTTLRRRSFGGNNHENSNSLV